MKTTLSIIAVAAGAMLMVLPMHAAEKAPAARTAWPAETLSGRIMSVDPTNNIVVVKTSDGIPFDFDLTRHTSIKSGDHSVAMKDLSADVNKNVSVTFKPEQRGDVAESMRIG
jgi:hypothetical protein